MNPIYRTLYLFYRMTSGARYRGRRRFTRAGLAVFSGAVFAMFLGVDRDNTVGYQAFAILMGLILVAFVFSWFFRMRFTVGRALPRFATAGLPFKYTVTVRNLTAKNQTGLLLLENLLDTRPTYKEWKAQQKDDEKHIRPFSLHQRRRTNPFKRATAKEAPVPALPPGQSAEVSVEVTPLRRGVLRFAGVTLVRPDPLGLCRAMSKIDAPQSMLILPKRYWIPPVALPGALQYQQGGVALAANVGRSEEFVALREYRRGDPLRHIHWRSWARVGKPIVKEFEDEFFVRHALVLDTFTERPQSDVFEEAISVAASFACTVLTQESLLDLLFVGPQAYCLTAGRGLAHADQMLEILASVQPCSEQPFASLEHLVLNHANTVSGCICVLLAWDEPRRELVRKLRSLGLPVLVLVVVEKAGREPLDAGPMSDDPQRLQVLEIGRIEEQLAVMK